MKKLLMISGDRALAQGKQGAFYNTIEEFHKHWERIDVIVPRVEDQKIKEVFGNVFVHSSPWPLLWQTKFIYRKGRELFKQHKFDLMTVHEYPPFYNGIGAYLLSLATHVPYVLEIMHIAGLPKAGSLKEFIYKYFTAFFIRFDAGRARAIRVINQRQTKDFLIRSGVPASKIKYIPAFYINLDIFKPESVNKKYDLVYVARLEKNKGIQNLIEAIAILKQKKSDIRLIVIGQGPESENLKFKIKNLKLDDHVELMGWLKGPEDVARLLNQSRVFVNPSFNEGGPRSVLEAMACGVPVVTTPVGLMIDIIKDGENGLLCDWNPRLMADKIHRMLDDIELQERCSKAGVALVQRFERGKAIADYAEALENISKKRLLVITQKVNENDQLLGFFIEWLRHLNNKLKISVLCLEKGQYDLSWIFVESLGKEKGNSKLSQLWNFYSYIIKKHDTYDAVFVHMNPIWAVFGGWYWRLKGKKVVLWYTSKGVTLKLRLALWFSNVVLTASSESFRIQSKKVVVTGHGIDTDLFKPDEGKKINDGILRILSVGRISPVKNYGILVDAIKILADKGIKVEVSLIGEPALSTDKIYQSKIKDKIRELGLEDRFKFVGKVDHNGLPVYYQSNDVFIHLSKTGSLDKTLLEAMTSGMRVLSSNDAARGFLPASLIFNEDNYQELADKIETISREGVDSQLRQYVIEKHNLNSLVSKIVAITNK